METETRVTNEVLNRINIYRCPGHALKINNVDCTPVEFIDNHREELDFDVDLIRLFLRPEFLGNKEFVFTTTHLVNRATNRACASGSPSTVMLTVSDAYARRGGIDLTEAIKTYHAQTKWVDDSIRRYLSKSMPINNVAARRKGEVTLALHSAVLSAATVCLYAHGETIPLIAVLKAHKAARSARSVLRFYGDADELNYQIEYIKQKLKENGN